MTGETVVNMNKDDVTVSSTTPVEIKQKDAAEPQAGEPVDKAAAEAPAESKPAGTAAAEGQPAEAAATGTTQATGGGEQVAAAPAPAAGSAMPAGDAASGEKIFRRCAACHKIEPGKNSIGPTLYGVVGRPVASVEGFNYSKAMQEHGGDWTPDRLDTYLADPKGVVPGTKMGFAGLKKEQDRLDVITYMQQASQ